MHTTTFTVSHKYAVGDTLLSKSSGRQVVQKVVIDTWGNARYEFESGTNSERVEYVDANWMLVVPETPLPETWTNRYEDGTSSATHITLRAAEAVRPGAGREVICTTHEFGTVENPRIEVVWRANQSI